MALATGGWMAFDGVHALIVGDYVTPKTGVHAGRLGPWSHVVVALGIEPRSLLMKSLFVAYGTAWLIAIGSFALGVRGSSRGLLAIAIASLWYFPLGTIFSTTMIVVLLLPSLRAHFP